MSGNSAPNLVPIHNGDGFSRIVQLRRQNQVAATSGGKSRQRLIQTLDCSAHDAIQSCLFAAHVAGCSYTLMGQRQLVCVSRCDDASTINFLVSVEATSLNTSTVELKPARTPPLQIQRLIVERRMRWVMTLIIDSVNDAERKSPIAVSYAAGA